MWLRNARVLSGLALLPWIAACGGEDEKVEQACKVDDATSCSAGQVCEPVEGGEPACFAPLIVRGRVLDSADEAAIAGARVVARDVNGELVSRDVAVSGANGSYDLSIPARRTHDGTPVIGEALLRADARGHATFPGGLRVALPVDTASPRKEEKGWIVENATTDIALDAVSSAAGTGTVSGRIDSDHAAGTLVIAGAKSAIAAQDGSFTVFDVAAGTSSVQGYKAGLQLSEASVEVKADTLTKDVVLHESNEALGSVSGSVSFVNAGSQETSVVLVVESTFNQALARGEVPIGLRRFPVTGAYSFSGVPMGKYVVLAAFENDSLVRDPDEAIGGTAIQHIEVGRALVDVPGFKITGALDVTQPGAQGAEVVTGPVTFIWADDSSEDGYEVVVHDTFGREVWRNDDVPRVTGSSTVTLEYGGPALDKGYYQFKATSYREDKQLGRVYISATEDLKGVFVIE